MIEQVKSSIVIIISWIFISTGISAQTYHDIPEYPNQESIEKEMSRLFPSANLSFLVYQPDILSYRNLDDMNPELDKFMVDDSIYSIILVSHHSPNCIVFLGKHITKMLTSPTIESLMCTLSDTNSVWVDNEEALLRVIVPWMIPGGCENVIFCQNRVSSCFQLSNERLGYRLNICFDLKETKRAQRECLVKKVRESALWAFLD
jgi:hypothetical protein